MLTEQSIDAVPLIVGVTGHRNLVADEIPEIQAIVRKFLMSLQGRFPQLPIAVMTTMDEGAGQVVASEAKAMGLKLIVPLPMPVNVYTQEIKDGASRQAFETLCDGAEILELPLAEGNTLQSITGHTEQRSKQYAQLGAYLSRHSHVLLALWDGKPSANIGDTAQVIQYHREGTMRGLQRRQHRPAQILTGNEFNLIFHIVCSRDQPDGAPAAGVQPLQCGFTTGDCVRPLLAELPKKYEKIFAGSGEFNIDIAKYWGRIRRAGIRLYESREIGSLPQETQQVDLLFSAADWLADHFQGLVDFTLRVTYGLAVLMGLAFILYADVPKQDFMIYVFLLIFWIGVLVNLIAHKRAWHRKYLDYRALAEGLRVQFFWQVAGVDDELGTLISNANFLQKQDIELGWIRNTMRVASLRGGTKRSVGVPGGLEYAVNRWIGCDTARSNLGQTHYFSHTSKNKTRMYVLTRTTGYLCLWAGIFISFILGFFGSHLSGNGRIVLLVMMGSLPLIAAVREAYSHKKADKELIKQYNFMYKLFQRAEQKIAASKNEEEKREILKALGHAALDEHAEWILMHRERPLEHGKL